MCNVERCLLVFVERTVLLEKFLERELRLPFGGLVFLFKFHLLM
jgi:hypothetical protein